MTDPNPLIETSIDVDVPIDLVWSLVGDPTASARWSPHVEEIVVTTDGPIGVGTRTTNRNRVGDLVWETQAEIIEYAPPTTMAFRTRGGRAVWSFELSSIGAGRCRVTHRRTIPDGLSDAVLELEAAAFGSVAAFESLLADGMAATLAALGADAARLARGAG